MASIAHERGAGQRPPEAAGRAATSDDLGAIAAAINAEHRACEGALRAGLAHAVRAGELLIRAKALCDHGSWLPWLAANFEGSERTARAYMRVARELPALAAENGNGVADLSFRGALAALAEPATETPLRLPGRLTADGWELPEGVDLDALLSRDCCFSLPWGVVMELVESDLLFRPDGNPHLATLHWSLGLTNRTMVLHMGCPRVRCRAREWADVTRLDYRSHAALREQRKRPPRQPYVCACGRAVLARRLYELRCRACCYDEDHYWPAVKAELAAFPELRGEPAREAS